MPIEVGIWRINGIPERVRFSALETESKLEKVLEIDISVLDPSLMVIGRQVPTEFGAFVDLLAVDAEGDLAVIELKRGRTPREVVAQSLDYASWVQTLDMSRSLKSTLSGTLGNHSSSFLQTLRCRSSRKPERELPSDRCNIGAG